METVDRHPDSGTRYSKISEEVDDAFNPADFLSARRHHGSMEAVDLMHNRTGTLASSTTIALRRRQNLIFTLARSICLLIHAGMVAIHLVLVGVWSHHLEHRIIFELGSASNMAATGITVLLQSFGTICTTLMVFSTQQIALRRQLSGFQTLTSTHDNDIAWSGLGSALLSLLKQFRLPASLWGVLFATLYLIGIALLHISTPALLSLETFDYYTTSNVSTHGMGNYTLNSVETQPGALGINSVLALQSLDSFNYLGLKNGTIYEIPDPNNGTGSINVTGTYFDVTCNFVSNTTVDNHTIYYEEGEYGIAKAGAPPVFFQNYLVAFTMSVEDTRLPCKESFSTPPQLNPPCQQRGTSPFLFIATSNPFYDSNGEKPGQVKYNQHITYLEGESVPEVQVLGCSLDITRQVVAIDAQTNLVQTVLPDPSKTHAVFAQIPPLSNQTLILDRFIPWNTSEEIIGRTWAQTLSTASDSGFAIPLQKACNFHGLNSTICGDLQTTITSEYLMTVFNMIPDVVSTLGSSAQTQNNSLVKLEVTLSQMTAAMYWADLYSKNSDFQRTIEVSTVEAPAAQTGLTLVSTRYQASRVTMSFYALVLGLSTSTILFSMVLGLIVNSRSTSAKVDGLGILQVLWLFKQHPEAQEIIAHVDHPTVDNLRHAGMAEIWLGED